MSAGTLGRMLMLTLLVAAVAAPANATSTYYRVTDLGAVMGATSSSPVSPLNDFIAPNSGWLIRDVSQTFDDGRLIAWGDRGSERHFLGLTPLSPGDATSDGRVDGADLGVWQQNYSPTGNGATFFRADWTGDGRVDGADLALWQRNYSPIISLGFPYDPEPLSLPPHAPEPLTVVGLLMAAGAMGLKWRRRRAS